jgi:hypothetical protein
LGEVSQGGEESDDKDSKVDKREVEKEMNALKRELVELLDSSNNENANMAMQRLKGAQQKGNGVLSTKFIPKKKNVRSSLVIKEDEAAKKSEETKGEPMNSENFNKILQITTRL